MQEAENGEFRVQGQPGLHKDILSQKQQMQINKEQTVFASSFW
jgi:hypothetical protein